MTEKASQRSKSYQLRAPDVLRVDGARKVMAQDGVSAPVYGVPF
jgi:hypothetical protein